MTIELERRAFVQTGCVLTAGAALATALPLTPAAAQTQAPVPAAKPATYSVKPLPFDPKTIKGLSERILVSHYENNYTGAVNRLNTITAQLTGLDYASAPGFLINGLKREELIATNSMILHELYFAGLGEESRPGAALADAIARESLACRVCRDGQGARWRLRLGAADLEPA